jgi:GNAT superfamily N-acetyltransferase
VDIIATPLENPQWLRQFFPDEHDGKFDVDPKRTTFWLAFDGDELVGVVAAERRTNKVWYFCCGVVHPNWRRRGIFRKLWDARMRWVMEHDPLVITGLSSPYNRKVFEGAGFDSLLTKEWSAEYDEVLFYKDFSNRS